MSEPDHARQWRLTPGAHAVPEAGSSVLLTTPTEEIARVDLPGTDRDLLLDVVTGRLTPDDALRRATDADLLVDVLDACDAEGIAGPVPELLPGRPTDVVAVEGDNPLADTLRTVLACAGFDVVAGTGDADLFVACAGWLPDAHWQRTDADENASRRPWHRAHMEGTRIVIGPFSIAPDGPSYADTRLRRLAASAWPDELETLWRHLDTEANLPPVPWPDAGILAVAAGHVVADLCAYRAGRRPPGADRQIIVDPATASWQAHPVLALPTGIMRTALA